MSDLTGEFIELFRQLEAALRESCLTADGPREFNGMLMNTARRDPFIQKRFNELDLCRQLRNILSHFPMVEGRRPLVPDESLLQVMRESIHHLQHPILAKDAAIPRERLYTVSERSYLHKTVKRMGEMGYSHIPVMRGARLIGVFSMGTVFTAVSRESFPRDAQARIEDVMELIAPENHEHEAYAFVAADTPLSQVKELFQRPTDSRRKVAAAFVTRHGRGDEPLLGMLTPWDVLQALDD